MSRFRPDHWSHLYPPYLGDRLILQGLAHQYYPSNLVDLPVRYYLSNPVDLVDPSLLRAPGNQSLRSLHPTHSFHPYPLNLPLLAVPRHPSTPATLAVPLDLRNPRHPSNLVVLPDQYYPSNLVVPGDQFVLRILGDPFRQSSLGLPSHLRVPGDQSLRPLHPIHSFRPSLLDLVHQPHPANPENLAVPSDLRDLRYPSNPVVLPDQYYPSNLVVPVAQSVLRIPEGPFRQSSLVDPPHLRSLEDQSLRLLHPIHSFRPSLLDLVHQPHPANPENLAVPSDLRNLRHPSNPAVLPDQYYPSNLVVPVAQSVLRIPEGPFRQSSLVDPPHLRSLGDQSLRPLHPIHSFRPSLLDLVHQPHPANPENLADPLDLRNLRHPSNLAVLPDQYYPSNLVVPVAQSVLRIPEGPFRQSSLVDPPHLRSLEDQSLRLLHPIHSFHPCLPGLPLLAVPSHPSNLANPEHQFHPSSPATLAVPSDLRNLRHPSNPAVLPDQYYPSNLVVPVAQSVLRIPEGPFRQSSLVDPPHLRSLEDQSLRLLHPIHSFRPSLLDLVHQPHPANPENLAVPLDLRNLRHPSNPVVLPDQYYPSNLVVPVAQSVLRIPEGPFRQSSLVDPPHLRSLGDQSLRPLHPIHSFRPSLLDLVHQPHPANPENLAVPSDLRDLRYPSNPVVLPDQYYPSNLVVPVDQFVLRILGDPFRQSSLGLPSHLRVPGDQSLRPLHPIHSFRPSLLDLVHQPHPANPENLAVPSDLRDLRYPSNLAVLPDQYYQSNLVVPVAQSVLRVLGNPFRQSSLGDPPHLRVPGDQSLRWACR